MQGDRCKEQKPLTPEGAFGDLPAWAAGARIPERHGRVVVFGLDHAVPEHDREIDKEFDAANEVRRARADYRLRHLRSQQQRPR